MMLDMVGSADAVRCGVVGKQAKLVLAKRLKGAAVPGLYSECTHEVGSRETLLVTALQYCI